MRRPYRVGSRWCPTQYEAAIAQLQTAQQKTDDEWSERIAHELAHTPKGDLVIRNARLFDPRDLSVTPGTSVLVRGDRIVRVGRGRRPEAIRQRRDHRRARPLPDARVVGQPPAFQRRRWRARSGQRRDQRARHGERHRQLSCSASRASMTARELGPRVLKAGIIDGTGEFAGPDQDAGRHRRASDPGRRLVCRPRLRRRSRSIPPSNPSWFRSSPIMRMRAGCG